MLTQVSREQQPPFCHYICVIERLVPLCGMEILDMENTLPDADIAFAQTARFYK